MIGNTTKKLLLLLITLPIAFGCVPQTEISEVGIDLDDIYKLDFIGYYKLSRSPEISVLVRNQLTGVVTRINNDPDNSTNFGKFIEFKHKYLHQKDGEIVYEEFFTIYGMLGEIYIDFYGELDSFMEIGTTGRSGPIQENISSDILMCAWSYKKTEYLEEYFGCKPVKYKGVYWYHPEKIIR